MGKQTEKPTILLVNDDGIDAPGLRALVNAVSEVAEIAVVAPLVEKSAVGHAITLTDPLRVFKDTRFGDDIEAYAVKGTPADCVKIACWALLDRTPDMVISGINLGSNTGINTIYSGTVSAATEGAILGIPSFAVSLTTFRNPDFSGAARFAAGFVPRLLEETMPPGVYLNINVPAIPFDQIKGVAVTRQGQALYREHYDRRLDPHGAVYYWLAGQKVDPETDVDVDEGAIQAGYISVTPIHYDLTRYDFLDRLRGWDWEKSVS